MAGCGLLHPLASSDVRLTGMAFPLIGRLGVGGGGFILLTDQHKVARFCGAPHVKLKCYRGEQ